MEVEEVIGNANRASFANKNRRGALPIPRKERIRPEVPWLFIDREKIARHVQLSGYIETMVVTDFRKADLCKQALAYAVLLPFLLMLSACQQTPQ